MTYIKHKKESHSLCLVKGQLLLSGTGHFFRLRIRPHFVAFLFFSQTTESASLHLSNSGIKPINTQIFFINSTKTIFS
uniref:Ovule protein n=1 Tax=Ascaris lumbricoides TaxID=6252 RepID=A0A0M3HL17_ASCLU